MTTNLALVEATHIETFHDSLARCETCDWFYDRFYDRLIDCSVEIESLLKDADLSRIKLMLRQSLVYIMLASGGSPNHLEKLKGLAKEHKRLNVKPEYFDVWLDVLVTIVEEADQKYSVEVDESWRKVLAFGVSVMKTHSA